MQNDWSQFIPDIISGLVLLLIGWFFSSGLSTLISKRTGNKRFINLLFLLAFFLAFITFIGFTLSGASQMSSRQLTISIGYFLISFIVVMAIYLFFVLPIIKNVDIVRETQMSPNITPTAVAAAETIPELAFSNTQISVTSSGDVILRTVISSMAEGNRKPVNILLPSNFSISE